MAQEIELTAETPNRIDLAGGTVDLHPIDAFLGGTFTVNAAIEVRSRARFRTRSDGRFRLTSEDLGATVEIESLDALVAHPRGTALDLLIEALAFWRPRTGLDVSTKNDAPKGSGLGASSALLVALLGGLRALEDVRGEVDAHRLVDWCSNVEAKLLQVPTGKQDYYAALLAGPLSIEFPLAGPRTEILRPTAGFVASLEQATSLYFTGEPHFSGAPNWSVLKRYVDGDAGTRGRLARISEIARRMRVAMERCDLEAVARLLGEEWEERRGLAEGVSTPQIERIIAGAKAAGAWAAKACGAGGGGCLIVMGPPEKRDAITAAAVREDARPIPLKLATEGLRIRRGAAS